jgi:acyl-CoA thioester hydrolase
VSDGIRKAGKTENEKPALSFGSFVSVKFPFSTPRSATPRFRSNLKWRRAHIVATVTRVSGQVFRHIYRVVYADCTIGNHIYYSRYLDILEAARGEFFRHLGVPLLELQGQDVLFPVIECRLRYKSPARYDDVLAIELWTTLAQGARLNFGFRILNEEKTLILEGETFHVCTGVNEKPKRLPAGLEKKFQGFSSQPESQQKILSTEN